MASYTTNLNLKKPAAGENYSVTDQNGNMDIIDGAIGGLKDSVVVCVPMISGITIDGSSSSVGTTTIPISGYVPSGYSPWTADILVKEGSSYYQLPWFNDSLTQFTRIDQVNNSAITIKNKASWTSPTAVWITLFCKKN